MADDDTRIERIPGPLVVSKVNPRYFVTGSGDGADGQVVYLTGSHVNNNFHDGMGPGLDCGTAPERADYRAYLRFLTDRGHNFIRLWRWELVKSQLPAVDVHFCATPQPWLRTGPGAAADGGPKFDLSRFDPEYFDRLRDRVTAAGEEGIYVSVMLFEGFSLHLTAAPDNVGGHPFHAANNVNGIGITTLDDYQVLPLDARVQALQEAYLRRVIDTVHDLPNVLYEVSNESSGGGSVDRQFADQLRLREPFEWGDSTSWQYQVIEYVRNYEQQKGYHPHPVGMTMQFPVPDPGKTNDPLFAGPADWISPGNDAPQAGERAVANRWLEDPPVNDGRKVVLSDTDHYSPFAADALWAWKSFLRGHNPLLYDLGIAGGANPDSSTALPGAPSFEALEPARHAMGDTRRFAQLVNLIRMQPRGELASTGYALANPGQEYLILQPSETAGSFTVELEPGTYTTQWYSPAERITTEAAQTTATERARIDFRPPFVPAVLYLRHGDVRNAERRL
jgi:hypothetical protein